MSETKHTISDPLKIQWDGSGYNVNKPNIDHEVLISKSIADDMLEALKELYNAIDSCIDLTPELLQKCNRAIQKAEGK